MLLWAAVLLAVANVVGEWAGAVPPGLLLMPAALAVLGLLAVAAGSWPAGGDIAAAAAKAERCHDAEIVRAAMRTAGLALATSPYGPLEEIGPRPAGPGRGGAGADPPLYPIAPTPVEYARCR